MIFFADSYALMAHVHGSVKYREYFKKHEIITSRLNLLELHYGCLLETDLESADKAVEAFHSFLVDLPEDIFQKASLFKFHHRKENISYIDAIGYETAKQLKVKFLTGDNAFQGKPGVEFVKE